VCNSSKDLRQPIDLMLVSSSSISASEEEDEGAMLRCLKNQYEQDGLREGFVRKR